MRAERLCPATIPAEKKCARTIAPLMTRLLNTRCIGAAFVALAGLGWFLQSALPRWIPVIYGGAWRVLGLPDGRNVPLALHDLPVVLIDGRNEGGPIAVLISGNGAVEGAANLTVCSAAKLNAKLKAIVVPGGCAISLNCRKPNGHKPGGLKQEGQKSKGGSLKVLAPQGARPIDQSQ